MEQIEELILKQIEIETTMLRESNSKQIKSHTKKKIKRLNRMLKIL